MIEELELKILLMVFVYCVSGKIGLGVMAGLLLLSHVLT